MDRQTTSPFALQLFYRTGAFHRPDEFSTGSLPPYLTLHTWPDCTLGELAQHIAAADDRLLPETAIGTRLAFRLIFQDTRGAAASSASKYTVKELGSVVIGDGGPGLSPEDVDIDADLGADFDADDDAGPTLGDTDPGKTLGDARFVVGDYVSCAILPPLPDGSVAPASSARMGRGTGAGESRLAVGRAPDGPARDRDRDRDRDAPFPRHGRGRGAAGGRGGYEHFGSRGSRSAVPTGEWRRGEKLPDMPSGGPPRNRGRF
ncbi:putative Sin3 associated polypeptide p18 [Rosellinia necatrix]|uniref:Putative Sin3 associated polypeptide p18 n=1 Tax=Rosellinia necatrix TaxID=77044 RepID=A0A1W2TNR4_ROSNE|nr:putative Sin3 associated polypeptide p18 [Rosellinia necatrix]